MKKLLIVILLCLVFPELSKGSDIKLGVEVEFRSFYLQRHQPNFSFQFREAKLFFDTFISENASALLEFELKKGESTPLLERGYFIWRFSPLKTQLRFGQFRIPFGYWDAYTIERALIKNTFIGDSDNFRAFKLRNLDVGIEIVHTFKTINIILAMLNGSRFGAKWDENNNKDLVASVGYAGSSFSLHANAYWGKAQRLENAVDSTVPSTRSITAYGADLTATMNNITISGEAVLVKYYPVRSFGAYLQFNYDLLDFMYGMRLIGKVEYWNPDTNVGHNDLIQAILGIKQSVTRGVSLQLEYRYHTRRQTLTNNGAMLELELEL